MRVATDQRHAADDRQPSTQPPPRLGGTDLFRGAMVILAAVVIGGVVLSRGIDDDDGGATAGTELAEADPAAGGVSGTDGAGTDGEAEGSAATDGAQGAADSATDPVTGATAGTDTATDPTTAPADPADDPTTDSSAPADTTTTTTSPLDTVRAPAEVRTLVLNAGGPQGIAGRATELLQGASYLTAAAKNADVNGPSAVYYIEGYQEEAIAVASVFGPGVDALVQPLDEANPPTAELDDAAVIVVIGNDDVIPGP